MTPAEEKQIASLNERLSKEIQIEVIQTAHEKSLAIRQFCDQLTQLVPKIHVKKEEGDPDEVPAIGIHNGLRYQAVPSGTEVGPFIEALELKDSGTARMEGSAGAQLAKIDLPTHLVVYVSPQCKFCPGAVYALLPLPALNENIRLTVVDAMHFPELADRGNIQSLPTLILEDQFRWSGSIQIDEIVEVMVNRDPSFLGPASLEMMLKEGKAGQLAGMMMDKGEIFQAFYTLLTHSKWPVRLGAMVVMDELIEKNPVLALQTQDYLLRSFNEVADTVKGDLLYMIGQMGRRESITFLQNVLTDEYGVEVKEAAREALDKVISRIK
jgi:hypothetical protein